MIINRTENLYVDCRVVECISKVPNLTAEQLKVYMLVLEGFRDKGAAKFFLAEENQDLFSSAAYKSLPNAVDFLIYKVATIDCFKLDSDVEKTLFNELFQHASEQPLAHISQ